MSHRPCPPPPLSFHSRLQQVAKERSRTISGTRLETQALQEAKVAAQASEAPKEEVEEGRRRHEAEGGRQTGGRQQEAVDRKQAAGGRGQEAGGGRQTGGEMKDDGKEEG